MKLAKCLSEFPAFIGTKTATFQLCLPDHAWRWLAKKQSEFPDIPGVITNCGAAPVTGRPFVCVGSESLPSKTEEQRERAEAKFERLQRVAEEGRIAMAEYKAAALAMRAKTERLRALRLAREAGLEALPPPGNHIVAEKSTRSAKKQTRKRAKAH
jgi:hypothetical protein